jgi:Ca2+-transporting ATPase
LIEYGILASQKDSFDPMGKAFKSLSDIKLVNNEYLCENWEFVQQYFLSQKLLAMSHAWESLAGNEYIIVTKGAPESIVNLCHLDNNKKATLEVNVTQMAG